MLTFQSVAGVPQNKDDVARPASVGLRERAVRAPGRPKHEGLTAQVPPSSSNRILITAIGGREAKGFKTHPCTHAKGARKVLLTAKPQLLRKVLRMHVSKIPIADHVVCAFKTNVSRPKTMKTRLSHTQALPARRGTAQRNQLRKALPRLYRRRSQPSQLVGSSSASCKKIRFFLQISTCF